MNLVYLKESDKKEFLELFNKTADNDVWQYFWDEYSQSDTKVIYCAWIKNTKTDKDIIIGTVSLLVEKKPYSFNPVVYITDLVVLPKYRRLGLGTEILQKVIDEAKTYFPNNITLSCDKVYEEFYKKLGFENVSITMEYK